MKNIPFIQLEMEYIKKCLQSSKWLIRLFIFTIIFLTMVIINLAFIKFSISPFIVSIFEDFNKPYGETSDSSVSSRQMMKYIVDTQSCRIPDLNPFDLSTKSYISEMQIVRGKENGYLPIIDINNASIIIDPKVIFYYNDTKKINCCWRTFWPFRIQDSYVVFSKKCNSFSNETAVKRQYFRVECRLPNNKIYEDEFAILPRKAWLGLKSNSIKTTNENQKLNVLVIGMNSVSRLNLYRSMPKTIELLKKLGAIEMLGYHKIVHNMYGNLVPLLTGLPYDKFEKLYNRNPKISFDKSPSLWKDFAANGYRTIIAERHEIDSGLDYNVFFKIHPANYSFRPLCLVRELQMGIAKEFETFLCDGYSYTFDELLQYIKFASNSSDNKPHFDILWQAGMFQHSIDNAKIDSIYSNFFSTLNDENLLRNTALIFMSDRGMDRGFYSYTHQGRLEENLPFMYVKMPDWWKEQHPDAWESLKKNTGKLTTTFDVHETLKDILNPSRLQQKEEDNVTPRNVVNPGVSLFKPISDKRTCETAGVLGDCSCYGQFDIILDKSTMTNLSTILMDEINSIISKEPLCAKLEFSSLVDVKPISGADYKQTSLMTGRKSVPDNWNRTEYSVIFQTKPGYGTFEALMRHDYNEGLKLVSSINRLDSYEDQSACVNDFNNRFYCFCQSNCLLDRDFITID